LQTHAFGKQMAIDRPDLFLAGLITENRWAHGAAKSRRRKGAFFGAAMDGPLTKFVRGGLAHSRPVVVSQRHRRD